MKNQDFFVSWQKRVEKRLGYIAFLLKETSLKREEIWFYLVFYFIHLASIMQNLGKKLYPTIFEVSNDFL